MSHFDVVIVGGGHAGANAAIALRQNGFTGSVAVVGLEPDFPYERPPLSKDYLAGEKSAERLFLRPPEFWGSKQISMLLGQEVVAVDPVTRNLALNTGNTIAYGDLIWAAGGEPRRIQCSGADLRGVHYVRKWADVDAIKAELDRVICVAVIGGGYIGLEAAASLRKLGKTVLLFEAMTRVLARVAGEEISTFFEATHRAHGVDLRTSTEVAGIVGDQGVVSAIQLADGQQLPCDMVIVGIGIIPSVAPLLAAGAEGGNGVGVDEYCRTSLPHIYAIGDCASHASRFADGMQVRLESVQNANDQAVTAAKMICGQPTPYTATPWFWSNQYDSRLQTVGLSMGHDTAVTRGNTATGSFSVVYLKQGRVIALDCVNAVRDYAQGRKLVEQQKSVSIDHIGNHSVQLSEL